MRIECKLGATEQIVLGNAYSFQRDRHGRYVAEVHDDRAAQMFLSVEHYVEAPDIAPPPPPAVIEEADEGDAPVTAPALDLPQLDHDGDGKPGGSKKRARKA